MGLNTFVTTKDLKKVNQKLYFGVSSAAQVPKISHKSQPMWDQTHAYPSP